MTAAILAIGLALGLIAGPSFTLPTLTPAWTKPRERRRHLPWPKGVPQLQHIWRPNLFNVASLQQAVWSESVGNVNTRDSALTSTPTAGNTLICMAQGWRSGGINFSFSDGTNTFHLARSRISGGTGANRAVIYYAYNISATATPITCTPTGASSYYTWSVIEVAGLTTTDPLDKTMGKITIADTVPSTGSTSKLQQADEFAVCVLSESSGVDVSGAISVDSGFTQILEELDVDTHNAGEMDYKIVAARTALNVTWTAPENHNWCAVIATFKAAGGSAPANTFDVTQTQKANSFNQNSPFTMQGSNATAGDIYLLAVGHTGQPLTTITDDDPGSSWTRIDIDDRSGGSDYTEVWWRPVTGDTAPIISVAWASGQQSFIDLLLIEYRGLDASSPVDVAAHDHGTAASAPTVTTGTATVGGVGMVFAWEPTVQHLVTHTGFTQVLYNVAVPITGPLEGWMGYQTANVTASSTFTATVDLAAGTELWGIVACVLKLANNNMTAVPGTASLILTTFAPNIGLFTSNTPRLNAKYTHFWGGR